MPYIGNSPKNNVRDRFYYTATSGQTLFSGSDLNGKTLAYQDGRYVDVYLNGVILQDTTDYTATTKTSVTLVSGATTGDLVEIVAYGIFSVSDTVSAASGGDFAGEVQFSGGIGGDVSFDTNTLHVDATNNRVGVGTASPSAILQIDRASANFIRFADSGSLTGLIGLDDGATLVSGGADGDMVIRAETSGKGVVFAGNAATRFGMIDADGLKFNTDTAAANALDDYEQGSYTPSFSFTNGNGTLSVGAAVGSYTKIGNRVHLNFYIKIGTKGTASGDMRFSGLPYTPASVSNRYHSGSIWMNTTVSTGALDGNYMTMLLLSPGDATIRPYVMAGSGSVTHVNAGHVQNNTDFAVSMSFDTE